jgi:hypothetical protein
MIVGTLMNFVQTVVLIISGKLFGFPLFQNCEILILFKFFFSFGQNMVYLAFLLTTLVDKLDKAIQLTFIVILGNVMFMIVFVDCPLTLTLFYSENMKAVPWN